MDEAGLSIFRNYEELKYFSKGFVAGLPLSNKYQDGFDEWYGYSDTVDINFYVTDGYIYATAYKVDQGETDTSSYERVYHEQLLLTHLIKKAL